MIGSSGLSALKVAERKDSSATPSVASSRLSTGQTSGLTAARLGALGSSVAASKLRTSRRDDRSEAGMTNMTSASGDKNDYKQL